MTKQITLELKREQYPPRAPLGSSQHWQCERAYNPMRSFCLMTSFTVYTSMRSLNIDHNSISTKIKFKGKINNQIRNLVLLDMRSFVFSVRTSNELCSVWYEACLFINNIPSLSPANGRVVSIYLILVENRLLILIRLNKDFSMTWMM